jgi:hypothetical protein
MMMLANTIFLTAVMTLVAAAPGGVPIEVSGDWKVVKHYEPGISAMSKTEADSWVGKKAHYEETLAEFDAGRCVAPTYTVKMVDAEIFFIDEFRVRAASLGVTAKTVSVVEIACSGSSWASPGGLVVVKSKGRILTVWNGVFFELSR